MDEPQQSDHAAWMARRLAEANANGDKAAAEMIHDWAAKLRGAGDALAPLPTSDDYHQAAEKYLAAGAASSGGGDPIGAVYKKWLKQSFVNAAGSVSAQPAEDGGSNDPSQ